jgi:14-3-3 protein epsilon
MSNEKPKEIFLAMLAEQCERYDDMFFYLEILIENNNRKLDIEERNLFSIACYFMTTSVRSSLRILNSGKCRRQENSPKFYDLCKYIIKLEEELESSCLNIIRVIDNDLLPYCTDPVEKLFYYKLKGTQFSHIIDNISSKKNIYKDLCLSSFQTAIDISINELGFSHPVRLSVALNLATFYYEVENNEVKAIDFTRKIIQDCSLEMIRLNLDPDDYAERMDLIALLKDNLNSWSISEEN